MKKYILFCVLWIVAVESVLAQTGTPLEILSDEIALVTINGKSVRKLTGNVQFKRTDGTLFADTVYQYVQDNYLEAFGNVRLNNQDGSTITGEKMYYYTATKQVKIVGNVVMTNAETTLQTPALDYDMNTGTGVYTNGGVLRDANSTLTSNYGKYNRLTKISFFKGNVHLQSENNQLFTDSLFYHQDKKTAYFKTNTRIISKDGTLRSDDGAYNTQTELAQFYKRTTIESTSYFLMGDKVNYNKAKQQGNAQGNVMLVSKKDSTIITGENAFYDEKIGIARVVGNALLKKKVEKDTLFIQADTLLSIEKLQEKKVIQRTLFAYHNVKIYQNDLQGICDSLTYNFLDSMICMYETPVLWNKKNQLTADTIKIQLANNEVEILYLNNNAFIVSQDTAGNYNQVKGNRMKAHFVKNKLQKINVIGGGQSIYFAIDEKTFKLVGMNYIICSDIQLRTQDDKITEITFIREPEGRFVPPHEIEKPDTKLKGFSWRMNERPERNYFTN
jgi:lipopolysaccharide export system protein LptA